jgi:HAD superfamily hydrolase (TIGR01509 family)
MRLEAIIFDCDGVLVDTERDGHRVAFNRAFTEFGIGAEWDPEVYKELVKVAGGKERMKHYFNEEGWPAQYEDRDQLIKELHVRKTALFMELINSGQLPLRPGVKRLVDEAISGRIKLAVCSTSNEKSVNLIVDRLLGPERKSRFQAILAGDVVSRKKPDPEIYNLCRSKLNLDPMRCVVIEDSRNGLLAAKGAGFRCLVTTNGYTQDEDFSEADRIVAELGDDTPSLVTLHDIDQLLNIQNIKK